MLVSMPTKSIVSLLFLSHTLLFPQAHFANGAVVEKLDYLPFGSERVNVKYGAFETRFTYTDQERDDESGLMYYGARYYHPVIGRFTQPDPVITDIGRKEFALAMMSPQLMNGYSYVGNNPLKYTDENGEFIDIILDVGFIAYDLYSISKAIHQGESVKGALASLTLDIGGAFIPGVTGLGMMARVAGKADDVVDAVKVVDKAIDAGKSMDKAADLAKAGQKLPDSALVVRGGAGTTPEVFQRGMDIHPSGVSGFSVESKAGLDLCSLCKNVPHNKVRTTTVKDIRAAGGDVISTKSNSPNHATVTNLNPQTANKVFSQPIKNPVPKKLRKR